MRKIKNSKDFHPFSILFILFFDNYLLTNDKFGAILYVLKHKKTSNPSEIKRDDYG